MEQLEYLTALSNTSLSYSYENSYSLFSSLNYLICAFANSKHYSSSPGSGYLPSFAMNPIIPYNAWWSYSDLPNLARSGVVSIPSLLEAIGFEYDCSQEWNLYFLPTFTFSIIPYLIYGLKFEESRSTVIVYTVVSITFKGGVLLISVIPSTSLSFT